MINKIYIGYTFDHKMTTGGALLSQLTETKTDLTGHFVAIV